MRRARLSGSDLKELSRTGIASGLNVRVGEEATLASGLITPVRAGHGILVLSGSMRGVRPFSAAAPAEPGLNIEVRLAGRSRSQETSGPRRTFELQEGQVLVLGSSDARVWEVQGAGQPAFDTVSFMYRRGLCSELNELDPVLGQLVEEWTTRDHLSVQPSSARLEVLARRALVLDANSVGAALRAKAVAFDVLADVVASSAAAINTDEGRLTGPDIDLVLAARREIARTPRIDLFPDQLARACGVSLSRLKRAFSQAGEGTPATAIRQKALETGRELLMHGYAVGDVSHMLGYGSAEAFSKAFRKAFGHSPRDETRNRVET